MTTNLDEIFKISNPEIFWNEILNLSSPSNIGLIISKVFYTNHSMLSTIRNDLIPKILSNIARQKTKLEFLTLMVLMGYEPQNIEFQFNQQDQRHLLYMLLLEDKKIIPHINYIDNDFIQFLDYLSLKLSTEQRLEFFILFQSIYESKSLSKGMAQFFKFYTTSRQVDENRVFKYCETQSLLFIEMILKTNRKKDFLKIISLEQLVERCIHEQNFKILYQVFKFDIIAISEMKNLYKQIALKLPKQFSFVVSLLAYLNLAFPEITKGKNYLIQQLAILLYLKNQLQGDWPIQDIINGSQFYIEQSFIKNMIDISKIKNYFEIFLAQGLIEFDQQKLQFIYNKYVFWKKLTEFEEKIDNFLNSLFLLDEYQTSQLMLPFLCSPTLQEYSQIFEESNLKIFMLDKFKFHQYEFIKWIPKLINVFIKNLDENPNKHQVFYQKLNLCQFIIQCLRKDQSPGDKAIFSFLHNFFISNHPVMFRLVSEVQKINMHFKGFQIEYIDQMINNVEALHLCLQIQHAESIIQQHKQREFISIFFVKLIEKYKIELASNIANLLVTLIKKEWIQSESKRVQNCLRKQLEELCRLYPEFNNEMEIEKEKEEKQPDKIKYILQVF